MTRRCAQVLFGLSLAACSSTHDGAPVGPLHAGAFAIALANGEEGYIPPPEQHRLGGYTPWPARTAGLEVQAEPRIVEPMLGLQESVSGRPRRSPEEKHGPFAKAVLSSLPAAYWRLGEFNGPEARDASGRGRPARVEEGVAFHLDGPPFRDEPAPNRAVHLAGGSVVAGMAPSRSARSVEFWFWNGMPEDARPVTAFLHAHGREYLGIGGTEHPESRGRIFFATDAAPGRTLVGRTLLPRREWVHVALVRDGKSVTAYLNGVAELTGEAATLPPSEGGSAYFGGRGDGYASLEGRLDEVAVFDRALSPREVAEHHAAAGLPSR